MSWNYRVVHCDLASPNESWLELREVHYDADGKISDWTQTASAAVGMDLDDLRETLGLMGSALDKPILKESELP